MNSRKVARDPLGVPVHLRYAYICQECAYFWGLRQHQADQPCPCCGHHRARRYRPVARLTRRQAAIWRKGVAA